MREAISRVVRGGAATVLLGTLLLTAFSSRAISQSAAAAPWSGWVQCRYVVQGAGYSHQETQQWTLSGPPVVQGNVEIYPTTWSAVGQGSLQFMKGNTTQDAQWQVYASGSSVQIAVTQHLDRFEFAKWSAQTVARGALTGQETVTTPGEPPRMRAIVLDVDERPFRKFDSPLTATLVNGSAPIPTNAGFGPAQPSSAQVTATCTWSLGNGTVSPAPAPPTQTPPAQTPPAQTPPQQTPPAPTGGGRGQAPAPTPQPTTPASQPGPSQSTSKTLPTLPTVPGAQCTMRGPAPISSRTHASPVRVYLGWAPVGGATGYLVASTHAGGLTAMPLAANANSFTHLEALDPSKTYFYTVTALYSQGCGATAVQIQPVAPAPSANVSNLPVVGQVKVNWRVNSTDAGGVLIQGSGLPQTGVFASPTYGLSSTEPRRGDKTIVGVPAGSHTWTISSFWNGSGGRVMGPATTVTIVVP
jgi:hypothetical protein